MSDHSALDQAMWRRVLAEVAASDAWIRTHAILAGDVPCASPAVCLPERHVRSWGRRTTVLDARPEKPKVETQGEPRVLSIPSRSTTHGRVRAAESAQHTVLAAPHASRPRANRSLATSGLGTAWTIQ